MWISQEVRTAIAWTPVRCNSFLVIRSLGIDIIGPLKEVTAWEYKYILVATGYSKWPKSSQFEVLWAYINHNQNPDSGNFILLSLWRGSCLPLKNTASIHEEMTNEEKANMYLVD